MSASSKTKSYLLRFAVSLLAAGVVGSGATFLIGRAIGSSESLAGHAVSSLVPVLLATFMFGPEKDDAPSWWIYVGKGALLAFLFTGLRLFHT